MAGRHRRTWVFLALGVVILASASCAGAYRLYQGPALQPEALAVLTMESPMILISFDGKTVPGAHARYEILPGSHTITVKCRTADTRYGDVYSVTTTFESPIVTITFDAAPKQSYTCFNSSGGNSCRPSIVKGM